MPAPDYALLLAPPAFPAERYAALADRLAALMSTSNDVLLIQAEAVLALEAAATSLARPGLKALNIVTSPYGAWFGGWLEKGGATVRNLTASPARPVTLGAGRRAGFRPSRHRPRGIGKRHPQPPARHRRARPGTGHRDPCGRRRVHWRTCFRRRPFRYRYRRHRPAKGAGRPGRHFRHFRQRKGLGASFA